MASNITITFPNHPEYATEMSGIKKSLSQFPTYKKIASALGKIYPQEIVAGLVGCIIIESKTDHTIINKKEYEGRGTSGTQGWNCGEGLIQWTFWKSKLQLIKLYNADTRATQKLPTTWEMYKRGTPKTKGKDLCAVEDGLHIAGLTFNNQILFLTKYYEKAINKLIKNGETNLAMIVAKIYQEKAGIGLMKQYSSDPIKRAHETAGRHYKHEDGNTYLLSLKLAQEYLGVDLPTDMKVEPGKEISVMGDVVYYDSNKILTSSTSKVINTQNISSINEGNKNKKTSGIVLGTHMKQK
jgi:hypothetical protein